MADPRATSGEPVTVVAQGGGHISGDAPLFGEPVTAVAHGVRHISGDAPLLGEPVTAVAQGVSHFLRLCNSCCAGGAPLFGERF